MLFMNEYEIEQAQDFYADHPVLGPATKTLANLMYWTNRHSDGWAYWPKPCRAAKRLQELVLGAESKYGIGYLNPDGEIDPADYKAALKPIKAFRTRQNADFEIVEVS